MYSIIVAALHVVAWMQEQLYSLARKARNLGHKQRRKAIEAMRNQHIKQEQIVNAAACAAEEKAEEHRALAAEQDALCADLIEHRRELTAQNIAAEAAAKDALSRIGY